MTQLDFFANDDDFYAVMDFVFCSTDLVVFEAYSRIDEAIRQFSSVDELRSVADERQKGSFLLRAWQPVDGYSPTFKSIKLEPHIGTHRTCLEGAGVIQFQQGSIEDGLLRASCFSHWDEAGARQRGFYPADPVNWRSLRTVSGRVYRLIKNKLAVAKLFSSPILPGAFTMATNADILWSSGRTYGIASPEIQLRPT